MKIKYMFTDIALASGEETIETTEAGVDTGILGSLGINGQLFLFQFINYVYITAFRCPTNNKHILQDRYRA